MCCPLSKQEKRKMNELFVSPMYAQEDCYSMHIGVCGGECFGFDIGSTEGECFSLVIASPTF